MITRTYPCPTCHGDREIVVNTTGDPQNDRPARCPECGGTGTLVCDGCCRDATHRVWGVEQPSATEAIVCHYCDGCFSRELAAGRIIASTLRPAELAHDGAAVVARFATSDVIGERIDGADVVTLSQLGGVESWDAATALRVAAAIVAAAHHAAQPVAQVETQAVAS
jgi:DNA-directed RNA polymerase subunit RPC12/RpoP